MRTMVLTVGPLATADPDGLVTSVTPTSGTALTLDGILVVAGVGVLDKPRRVVVVAGSEASDRTMLVTGTDRFGVVQSETITITASTAATYSSVLDYKTVTSLLPGGSGWSAAATIGTSGVASSQWAYMDNYAMPMTALQVDVSGTVSVTVQQTLDDPLSATNPVLPVNMTWINHPDSNLVATAVAVQGNYAYQPQWVRLNMNSGTGTATLTIIQSLSNT